MLWIEHTYPKDLVLFSTPGRPRRVDAGETRWPVMVCRLPPPAPQASSPRDVAQHAKLELLLGGDIPVPSRGMATIKKT